MAQDLKFKSAAAGPRPDLLDAIEREWGVRFPDDYRSFLLTQTGGRPASADPKADVMAWVPVDWQGKDHVDDEVLVHYIFVVEDWTGLFDDNRTELLTLGGRNRFLATQRTFPVPAGMLAIAEDPGGNLFFLETSGANRGSIWFRAGDLFDPEKAEADPLHNFGLVARSFSEFLGKFRLEEY